MSGRGIEVGGSVVRSALIAAGVALALLLPASATAKIVTHERDRGDGPQRVTAAQIERAEPRDVLRLPSAGAAAAQAAPAPDGPPRYIDGRPPAAGTAALSAAARPGATASGFRNFTSRKVADQTAYPNSTNGKVFGKIPGLGSYTCSASVVHAKNRSVLFTAGHCVKEPGRGGWTKKLVFIPSYDRGSRPFGRWTWDAIFLKRAWAKRGNPNFDYAAITMRRSKGRTVERTVGSLGFAFNVPSRRQTYRAVGYPFNKFDTEVMWECISTYGGGDPLYRKPGPRPVGIGCDMLGGASGGGWAIAENRLASVTSFGFSDRPNQLYGPRLTKKANKLRLRAGRRKVG
ncbi:MAG TPA: hypothetical protein VKA36_06020 [Solirubrobacterales bacterium]|nr:hypothetical protein [Solirubrobacterales bacterium]